MIPVEHEPHDMPMGPPEACCFCRAPTRMWTDLPTRTPGQQVACCLPCAITHTPAQAPSKGAWFDLERVRRWARHGPNERERVSLAWVRVCFGKSRREMQQKANMP